MPSDQEQLSLQNALPPCQEACPLHQDVRDYLFAIATGDFNRALEIIKQTNPLPFICGTICAHHCEDQCRRGDVDKAVSIRGLKRAAVEFGSSRREAPVEKAGETGKVAIIGGGPSGLTAAYDLAGQGCNVTVFEKEKSMGGAVRHYIPLYRLPDEAVDRDLEEIAAQGVEFSYGRELGQNLFLNQLEKEGYRAILVALGLPVSRGLDLPGAEGEGVLYALPFLKQVKREGFSLTGNPTVIVIGGGNVAIDVARSAARCGAGKVKVVCLESPEEMPAFPWEIKEAKEEGVQFYCSWGPEEIHREEGQITGLVTVKCTSVFDARGKFNPTLNAECRQYISGDAVIFAIGQGGDSEPLRGQLQLDERGRLVYNQQTFATSRRGVFACGEMVMGPGTAVQAMANGRLAARAILSYLQEEDFDPARFGEPSVIEKLDPEVREKIKQIDRKEIPMLEPEDRIRHFKQAELGFDVTAAVCEARRCLGCTAGAERIDELCANCLTCVRICPYGVPVINPDGQVAIRNEQCQTCGLCVGICPAYAIKFRSSYIEQSAASIESAVKDLLLRRNGE
ncbi:MAG TPA: FAD-dependent oxidoreductase, partial [Firmicutes bacterium]|nr:FAD-dependent oxidoreductase [Bacillota bacterium]